MKYRFLIIALLVGLLTACLPVTAALVDVPVSETESIPVEFSAFTCGNGHTYLPQ